jgi:hypothetical protein
VTTRVLGPTELVLDVSAELPFEERSSLAASVYLPDPVSPRIGASRLGNQDGSWRLAPPREPNHAWLHDPDVPAAVIAADDAQAVRRPRQSYAEALLAGHSARFAAELECNLFIAFGEHDVPPVPHADVAYYRRSRDVTLYVLPNCAHCHNFASTRGELWDRIGLWAGEQGSDVT